MRPSASSPKSPERLAAEVFGRRSEALAAWYLRAKLYRIRAMRVKTPAGEVDIVAERAGTLVFVEVKARRGTDSDLDALVKVNRQRIYDAARLYLMRNPALQGHALRFDVIFLAPFSWPRHVIGAFDTKGLR